MHHAQVQDQEQEVRADAAPAGGNGDGTAADATLQPRGVYRGPICMMLPTMQETTDDTNIYCIVCCMK